MNKILKIAVITTIACVAITLSSCTKCYVCQAKRDGNMVDFNKECGSNEDKQKMEKEFRAQYPDSVYFVTCN